MRTVIFEGRSMETGERVRGYYAKAVDSITDAETHVIFPLDTLLFPHNEFAAKVTLAQRCFNTAEAVFTLLLKILI